MKRNFAILNRPVLVAEDEPDDALLLQMALKKSGISSNVHIVQDGQSIIDYLMRQGRFADRDINQFPAIIFLDLKMPRMNGLEVLRFIKMHPCCKVIPTIVFTSSQLDKDVWDSYELGANSYLVKPASVDALAEMMKLTFDFWAMCTLPVLPRSSA